MTLAGPVVAVALATMLSALPWGLPPEARLVLPLMPFAVLHVLTAARGGRMPEWLAFAAGLGFDLLSDGPLGYSSLVYLAGHAASVAGAPFASRSYAAAFIHYAVTLVLLVAIEVALSSLYFGARSDLRPLSMAVAWAALAHPLLVLATFGASRVAAAKSVVRPGLGA